MSRPIVLLYHAVAPVPTDAEAQERRLFVHPIAFEKQMDYLARQGFRTLRLDEYAAAIGGARTQPRSVLLTFDDAYAHVDTVVTSILRRHGFTAVMFACFSQLGGLNTWDSHANLAQLTIAKPGLLRAMATGPWEIASHGLAHVDLRALPSSRRLADLIMARERLSALVRTPVVDLAYPFGLHDPAVQRDAGRAGYRLAFLAGTAASSDPLSISRRPVSSIDSMAMFRLKTHRWFDGLYRVNNLAPFWARSAARALLGVGSS